MTEPVTEGLRRDINEGRTLSVVGAGVSIAVSGGAVTASWTGLVRAGVDYAANSGAELPPGWKTNVLDDISLGEAGSSTHLISAAGKVVDALGGKSSGDFKRWLRETVGSLTVAEPDLIRAIDRLGTPVTTTNYDGLIEEVTSRPSVTWQQPSQVQTALQGIDKSVVHLHGYWREPESVTLEPVSYGSIVADESAQALQQAIATLKTLLFIGVGSGINDPNAGALRKWLQRTFPGHEARHYILCRDDELETLRTNHRGEQLQPIAYGREYGDLVSFLESLRPIDPLLVAVSASAMRIDEAPERAREAICDSARATTVLSDHLPDLEHLAISQILVPPVLLPVTHEQFVSALDLDRELRPSRCDPSSDVREHSCIVVVAEEGTGLTSALQWLISEASRVSQNAVPVIVDFRKLGPGHRPLERQVRRELMAIGALSDPRDQLPPCAIALDNVLTRPEKIFARALDELRDERYVVKVFGCRQGTEADLLTRLEGAGIEAILRYVGKMTKRDVSRMVALVEPSRATRLAEAILTVANREHLSRTPFTVGLLLSVLLHGEALLGTASETALLDAYVNLLLGRGDPHDDARFALDSLERADILATLAERFVRLDSGSLSEHQALEVLAEYFDEVGWSEDPIAVLSNLARRHVLAVRLGQVRFTQSSFLHLFAAKKAIASRQFRELLYGRALYYAPILRHYAALTRNDSEVLKTVEGLLWSADDLVVVEGGMFAAVDSEDHSIKSASSIEELLERLRLPAKELASEDAQGPPADGDEDDLFELFQDRNGDPDPFPLEKIEQAPAPVQVVAALMLVSNVLRDSELVKDVALKQRVLHRTLVVWGRFVELLEEDEGFQAFARVLGELFADVLDLAGEDRETHVSKLMEDMPLLSGYGGLASTLASRKLLRVLDHCFKDTAFLADPRGSVMGALLGFELQPKGWANYFSAVQGRHGDVKVVRKQLQRFAFLAYYYHHLSREDEERLQNFLVDQLTRDVKGESVHAQKEMRNRVLQQLRLNRVTASRRRVPLGETVFSGELADGSGGEELAAGSAEGDSG